jgi:hypothetical protein
LSLISPSLVNTSLTCAMVDGGGLVAMKHSSSNGKRDDTMKQ